MLNELRRGLEAEPDVAYAVLFGSTARGTGRPDSDADVAVELIPALLDYLDFKPVEERCAAGILRAAAVRGR